MLANLVFSCPNLSWNEPTDHVELFAGVCSITKGEWEECGDVMLTSMATYMCTGKMGLEHRCVLIFCIAYVKQFAFVLEW